ncbi:MAG: flagellar protein FlaG, partial [Bryobacteraceae bacterium]
MDITPVYGAKEAVSAITVPTEIAAENREVIQAVKALSEAELFGQDSDLTYTFDRETQRIVVRVVDRETKDVIRQIPPDYL